MTSCFIASPVLCGGATDCCWCAELTAAAVPADTHMSSEESATGVNTVVPPAAVAAAGAPVTAWGAITAVAAAVAAVVLGGLNVPVGGKACQGEGKICQNHTLAIMMPVAFQVRLYVYLFVFKCISGHLKLSYARCADNAGLQTEPVQMFLSR